MYKHNIFLKCKLFSPGWHLLTSNEKVGKNTEHVIHQKSSPMQQGCYSFVVWRIDLPILVLFWKEEERTQIIKRLLWQMLWRTEQWTVNQEFPISNQIVKEQVVVTSIKLKVPVDDNEKSACLQRPVLLIFLFWREANAPVVRIVSEVYPERFKKKTLNLR